MIIIKKIVINTESIELDKFLKWAGVLPTGGLAKSIIQMGEVAVNGIEETRRSKKLVPGDVVKFDGDEFLILKEPEGN